MTIPEWAVWLSIGLFIGLLFGGCVAIFATTRFLNDD